MSDQYVRTPWCNHCQEGGHEIVQCHALYKDLTNFAATASKFGMNQVARWGRARKNKTLGGATFNGTASYGAPQFVAASGVPVWNPTHQWTLGGNLTPTEVEMLTSYLEEQKMLWLWHRQMGTLHLAYPTASYGVGVEDAGWANHTENN